MDSDEDKELVLRAKHGDRAAFDKLHAKYKLILTRYCRRLLCNNVQEGEQAAQDAFLLAWGSLTSFKCECRFASWLKEIATNVCRKRWRTKKGKDVLQSQSLDDPPTLAGIEGHRFATRENDQRADEAEMRILAQQIVQSVLECAENAKPSWDALDLDIFELHYVQGVESQRDVAQRLKVNENTVRYRIYRHIEPVLEKVRREYEVASSDL